MHRVQHLDVHGNVIEEVERDHHADAAIAYIDRLLADRSAHLRWVDGDPLPGLPVTVVAERFGNPCEEPCCVPLAEPWPEH
jgi:hypothetical protein